MPPAFQLAPVPRITHAVAALARLGEIAAPLAAGRPVLLVVDPGLRGSDALDRVARTLRAASVEVVPCDAFTSDPTMAQADAAAALARAHRVGAVVMVGGGSALDLGKAVAALAPGTAPAAHYALCANPFPAGPLGKVCVPTTAGTGSEATRTAVLTDADGAKVWLWGDQLKADEILLDPELTVSLPPALTAATGLDALVHAIEACTNRNANPANDLFCHAAIRLVARHLVRAVCEPSDLEARSAMLLAATLAGIGIDNAGTAIAHNIGHALGSLRPIHHGRAVALGMLATLDWNACDDDGRYAAAAEAMGVDELPTGFERLLREVGLPVDLREEGFDDVTPERLAAQMARPENRAMRVSNLRAVGDEDLLAFARRVLSQR
jgi:alcohol dehydrogenase class IV